MILMILVALLALCVALVWHFASASRRNRDDADAAQSLYSQLSSDVAAKEDARRATARRRYVTASLKRDVMARDACTCQICGISRERLEQLQPGLGDYLLLEIDHVVPVASGGSGDDPENLQVLCWRCNRKKGKSRTNQQVYDMIDYGVRYMDS